MGDSGGANGREDRAIGTGPPVRFIASRVAAKARCRFFAIKRRGGNYESDAAKRARIDAWEDAVVDSLKDEGFEQFTIPKRLLPGGGDLNQWFQRMLPYGQRKQAARRVSSKFATLLNEHQGSCTEDDQGAFIADVFTLLPEPEVKPDTGGLAVLVAGAGACAEDGEESQFVERVLDEATDKFKKTLERRP